MLLHFPSTGWSVKYSLRLNQEYLPILRLLNGLLNLLLQSVPFPWKSELKSFANPYIINVFQVFQEPDQRKWYPKWISEFFGARFQRNRISSNPFIAKLIVQWDQQVETPPLWNLERPLFSRSLWVFALDLFVEKKMAKQFFKKNHSYLPRYCSGGKSGLGETSQIHCTCVYWEPHTWNFHQVVDTHQH